MKSRCLIPFTHVKHIGTAVSNNFNKSWVFLLISTLLIFSLVPAYAGQVTLSWDAVDDPAVAGYKLHYGEVPGVYSNSVDTGKTTSGTLFDLVDGKTYYFAATAYDASGNQSEYSNQTSRTIPTTTLYSLIVTKNGSGAGTVSGSGINCGSVCNDDFTQGTVVTLAATPASGSTFAGWSGACSGTGACTVAMNTSASVTATFNSTTITYDITATAKGSGTVTALDNPNVTQGTNGDTTISVVKVAKGASQLFTIAPKTGNYTASVSVDGSVVARNLGNYSYTFIGVTAPHTIDVTFATSTYTITASAGTGGTISPSSSVVEYGASQTFSITPSSGYKVVDVKVNGVSKGAVTSYDFSNVTTNQTISATFTAINSPASYIITASAGTGGSISPAGTFTVSEGSSKTFYISPSNKNYRISDVKVNGVSQGAMSSYTFSGITANQTIQASFARK